MSAAHVQMKVAPYVLELLFTVVMPYPGLEECVPRDQAKVLVLLSGAALVRTVFWRLLLFFPYPIRQKGKVEVVRFTGNLGRCRQLSRVHRAHLNTKKLTS